MPIRNVALVAVALLVTAIQVADVQVSVARAESWPALAEFVPKCPLIVHLRAEPRDAARDRNFSVCSVEEVICGNYRPMDFEHRPPAGFLILPGTYSTQKEGESVELIAFYGPGSVGSGNLLGNPTMALVVTADTVTYPPQVGDFEEDQRMSLANFKKHLRALASDVVPEKPAEPVPAVRPPDPPRPVVRTLNLEGSWKVYLPSGFEQAVTLTHVEGNQYRLAPKSYTFAGVYELQGSHLVLIESHDDAKPGAYRWQMHSTHLFSLVEQNHETGASYVGAGMFRPLQPLKTESDTRSEEAAKQAPAK